MSIIEKKEIRLVVKDEQSLYTPFSPADELDESVRSYIRSKVAEDKLRQNFHLIVMSQEPVDEERFRTAVSNWIRDEKAACNGDEKETVIRLAGSLVFGTILILLSIELEAQFDVVKYSLMPIMASLALSNAAGILIEKIPMIRATKWILAETEKNNMITFEYGQHRNNRSQAG